MLRAALLAAVLAAGPALGCGYCVEDKIAAVYDHAAVERARGAGRTTAYFAVDSDAARDEAWRRRMAAAAAACPGVERASVRVSAEAGIVALAFDPKRASLPEVHRFLEKRMAKDKLSLLPLRILP